MLYQDMNKKEQYDFDMDVEFYHNVYKGIEGVRPRFMDFYALTRVEFDVELNLLVEKNNEYWEEIEADSKPTVWFDSPQDNSWSLIFNQAIGHS